MDKIQFAIEQLRTDPNNNKYTDEELRLYRIKFISDVAN